MSTCNTWYEYLGYLCRYVLSTAYTAYWAGLYPVFINNSELPTLDLSYCT